LILLDTNILVRLATPTDQRFVLVDSVIRELHQRGEVLCVIPQNIYEFWAVSTRPRAGANGLGLSVLECEMEVARIKRLFLLLPDLSGLFGEWETLVRDHSCHGRVSHDARIVAAMRTHGVSKILTFNAADFVRFPDVTILVPGENCP
jgi:predicted nucleic acid-binding protein